MTSNKCLKYNHPTKPKATKAYMCERFDLKPFFLGKLRPERLTSNQMVGEEALSGGRSSPSISLGPNGRGPIIFI